MIKISYQENRSHHIKHVIKTPNQPTNQPKKQHIHGNKQRTNKQHIADEIIQRSDAAIVRMIAVVENGTMEKGSKKF